jgi:hypothetical protein
VLSDHEYKPFGNEFFDTKKDNRLSWIGMGFYTRCSPSDKFITIKTSSLSPGVYFMKVRIGEKVEVRKFVVVSLFDQSISATLNIRRCSMSDVQMAKGENYLNLKFRFEIQIIRRN